MGERMKHSYIPQGVCSKKIKFDIKDGLVYNIVFEGGCSGNLRAIGNLAQGKSATEIAGLISGVKCDGKGTSCPAQLALALMKAVKKQETAKKPKKIPMAKEKSKEKS
jgi:uncharacterized protein (TIGR03905 family)